MFREEVRVAQQDRIMGDVWLAPPLSWQLLAYGLFAAVACMVAFLFLGSYARVETISGQIEPDAGYAQIMPSRSGVITDMLVRDREMVTAGQPLARIRAEEANVSGVEGTSQALEALDREDRSLVSQGRQIVEGVEAVEARLNARISGLKQQVASLSEEMVVQRQLIDVARSDLDRAEVVARRGFVSRRDVQGRQEVLLGRTQQLANLEQSRAEKLAAISEALHSVDEARTTAAQNAAGLAGSRASLDQRRLVVRATRGYALMAPVSGTVTTISGRLGQAVDPARPIMTIIPKGAQMEARLDVPTRSVGFMKIGQEVRLQIDAFSYERFGTVKARINRISLVASQSAVIGGAKASDPTYVVTAKIDRPYVSASGEHRPLQPDMTLTARVVIERRSLMEWLFEPILAVRRR